MRINIIETSSFKMHMAVAIDNIFSRPVADFSALLLDICDWIDEKQADKVDMEQLHEEFQQFSLNNVFVRVSEGQEVPITDVCTLYNTSAFEKYFDSFSAFARAMDYTRKFHNDNETVIKRLLPKDDVITLENIREAANEYHTKVEKNNRGREYLVLLHNGNTVYINALNMEDLINIVLLEYENYPSAVFKRGRWEPVQKPERDVAYRVKIRTVDGNIMNVKMNVPKNADVKHYISYKVHEMFAKGTELLRYEKFKSYGELLHGGVRQCSSPRARKSGNPGRLGHVTYKIGF